MLCGSGERRVERLKAAVEGADAYLRDEDVRAVSLQLRDAIWKLTSEMVAVELWSISISKWNAR